MRSASMSMHAIDGAGSNTKSSGEARSVNRPSGFRIQVSRQGTTVHLSLSAGDEYAAVELYEHFVQALEQGRLSLELK